MGSGRLPCGDHSGECGEQTCLFFIIIILFYFKKLRNVVANTRWNLRWFSLYISCWFYHIVL